MNTPCHTPVPWHIAGISRPLQVSRVLSEEQIKTGCSFLLSVISTVTECANTMCMCVARGYQPIFPTHCIHVSLYWLAHGANPPPVPASTRNSTRLQRAGNTVDPPVECTCRYKVEASTRRVELGSNEPSTLVLPTLRTQMQA